MTELELKEKINEVKKEIKSINPKHTKKIAEKKAMLKELNAQLKELLKNVPSLSKETINLIDSTLAEDEYWEKIEEVSKEYSNELEHDTEVSKEIIATIDNSIYANKTLTSLLLNIYHKNVDNVLWYKSELKKLVKKATKRILKSFKIVTLEEKSEDMVKYTKITKKDLYEIIYKYSILGTVSDTELYNYINTYMTAR